jgi:predicted O-linked N-acetylglucosamine transferase (SPINDLY family)
VDILVDLKGYTAFNRAEILALRPAPIQVNYLGFPGTMSGEFMDYIVVDHFIAPPELAQHYGETIVRLPGSYQVNDRQRTIAPTPSREQLRLPEGAFVFCSFNQAYKITPAVFAIWMRLLEAVPGSVLWQLETSPVAMQNLRREMAKRGIAPERLVSAPRIALDLHLGRLRAADLALDTLPCNAHTTTSDALWAGVPLLTCSGSTFAARVAGSLLSAAGLPELITYSLEEYEARALHLLRNPADLAGIRAKLARNRETMALFDTPAFARTLEAAYLQMWDNHLHGGPKPIDL